MVDTVNTVGKGTPVAAVGQQSISRAPASTPVGTAAKTLSGGATAQSNTLTSRLYVDPTAGGVLVTEQISANGSIAKQVPSASVLAYLQNGLTIEGYPKQSTTV